MNLTTIPIEVIPDKDWVFRNIHFSQYKKWTDSKRRPDESDFILRIDPATGQKETGLSVKWDKYCTVHSIFVNKGLGKTRNGKDVNPKDFKVVKLNVGDIRNIKLLTDEKIDVIHKPEPNNDSHSEICCEDEDEIRLKLCDLVQSYQNAVLVPNFDEVNTEIEIIKKERLTQSSDPNSNTTQSDNS